MQVPYRTELAIMERFGGRQLSVYDTQTRDLKRIGAIDGRKVRIYCCGPTVYRDAHVGNLRTFLLADLVARTLRFIGNQVVLVQNITDVGHMSEDFEEDKMLASSREENRDPFSIARDYEARFHEDCAALNIARADFNPRASESIDLMLTHIGALIDTGYAYQGTDGSVYFAAEKFPSYGELSGNKLDALKPGHRYEYSDDGAKKFHADWALWKTAGNRTQMIWDSPWGKGFPGWHIECSAMSLHFLDGHVDLHIGGIDLRFPHHENERAQSNPITHDEAVSTWLHGEHLLFEGRKMSKSAGNVVLVKDLVARGIDPLALRFCLMENKYRSQMDLSWDGLTAANTLLRRWRESYQRWKESSECDRNKVATRVEAIVDAFCNDLNTAQAMILLRKIEKDPELAARERSAIFEELEPLLGLDLTQGPVKKCLSERASELLDLRAKARANKDFVSSDRLRDELQKIGVNIRDTAEGQVWDIK